MSSGTWSNTQAESQGQRSGTKVLHGFEDTVKDFWVSRPRRPMHGRKLAGVAMGVSNRYAVDPVVIRVVLVATTLLGGTGIVAYLLGWLLLPDERDRVSAFESLRGRGRSQVSHGFAVFLCIALVPATSLSFAGGWFFGGSVMGLVVLFAGLYLLHHSRGGYNRPTPVAALGSENLADAAFSHGVAETGTSEAGARPTGQESTGWDPLGAAPLGWDLPEHAPAPEAERPRPRPPRPRPPKRRPSKLGAPILGLALITAGVCGALVATDVAWFTVGHTLGLVLGVLGVGLVASSFLGGSRKLIGLAVPTGLVAVLMAASPLENIPGGVGSIERTPTSLAELERSYEHAMGNIVLDLTELSRSPRHPISINNLLGSTEVIVPPKADVTYTCTTTLGTVDCLGEQHGGIGTEPISDTDFGTNGRGGTEITLHITSGLGSVEVRRG